MVWGQAGFFSDPPLARNSRFALATCSPRFRLCSPEIRKKLRLFCGLLSRLMGDLPNLHTVTKAEIPVPVLGRVKRELAPNAFHFEN